MTRRSVVQNAASNANHRSSDRRNEIAYTYSRELDIYLHEQIFAGRFGEQIAESDTKLYVSQRKWRMGATIPGQTFVYEQALHERFWPACADASTRLLLVLGPEGIGKSTLLRYYFDHYLPHYPESEYAGADERNLSSWSERVGRHQRFYVDLRRGLDKQHVEHELFTQLDTQIRRSFPTIISENDYAMWERLAHWQEEHHAHGEELAGGRREYRRKYFHDHLAHYQNPDRLEKLVEEELWYLTQQKSADTGEPRHLVSITLDNIDQRTKDVQEYVIDVALSWLGDHAS